MTAQEGYRERVLQLLELQLRGEGKPLDEYMAENSNLPGPAANFGLRRAVGEALLQRAREREEEVWALLRDWAQTPVADAPANNPREFLPCTAALVNGQLAVALPGLWRDALARLREQARDARWRTREGVAQGLQTMARVDYPAVYAELVRWVDGGDLLEMRAAAAALAEPDLVRPVERARAALELHQSVLQKVHALPIAARRSDEFLALRKGLGYTVSVVVAALPDEGFARMREWASWPDKDVRWIVKENLGKRRLTKAWPGQVAELLETVQKGG